MCIQDRSWLITDDHQYFMSGTCEVQDRIIGPGGSVYNQYIHFSLDFVERVYNPDVMSG